MDTWRRFNRKISYTALNIFSGEDVCERLFVIGISHVQKFLQLFEQSLRKYIIWRRTDYSLEAFIIYCRENGYRRAEVLGIEYYEGNGGYADESHFLFGKASQFRTNPEPGCG